MVWKVFSTFFIAYTFYLDENGLSNPQRPYNAGGLSNIQRPYNAGGLENSQKTFNGGGLALTRRPYRRFF